MRFGLFGLALAAGTLLTAPALNAQAPAGAPAGANGICKDGSYSMQAKKDGACRGHKGVQTWYIAANAAPAAPAPSASRAAQSMPAPTAMPAPPQSMPPSQPANPRTSSMVPSPTTTITPRRSPSASAASKTAAPGGGPGLVWVNTSSNVYHCNGDDFYGKTKAGAYMSEADAKAKGARGARGQSCAGK